MRFTLFKKILLSLLFISTLMLVGIMWLVNSSFHHGLQDYINQGEKEKLILVAEKVSPYYSEEFGWQQIEFKQWEVALSQVFTRSFKSNKGPKSSKRNKGILKRVNLLDKGFNSVFQIEKSYPKNQQVFIPIIYKQQTVGWILTRKNSAIAGELEESFYSQQQRNFLWIVLWLTLISFSLAWFLVRHLLTPLKRLESVANSLQQGDYTMQIKVTGEDELSVLSNRFNELSCSLLQQKENREQWLADISHELRTPISVLKSEIEALQDGVRQPEPKYIDSLHDQVQNLSHLVNDLYQLSLSDSGMQFNMAEKVDILDVLKKSCSLYKLRCQEQSIQLHMNVDSSQAIFMKGDEKSLTQLFSNLLENSLRYTDAPGQIKVVMKVDNQQLNIIIEDSSPGVPNEALPKLFDRLYRVDESRSRLSGGSGLGLSICENIVKAHQGKMIATHSKLGGLTITINIPLLSVNKL
ncbi:ATP-binding protein [Pseudocolwellia sp. HL-MZ19]|uniref:ATP-binding protein n=1 Tax=unclassified Pseudocolwellia TaxID=2848178 RepID=UPI003CE9D1A5